MPYKNRKKNTVEEKTAMQVEAMIGEGQKAASEWRAELAGLIEKTIEEFATRFDAPTNPNAALTNSGAMHLLSLLAKIVGRRDRNGH